MSVKKGEKFGRGAWGVGGTSDTGRGRIAADAVWICGRGGGGIDVEPDSG